MRIDRYRLMELSRTSPAQVNVIQHMPMTGLELTTRRPIMKPHDHDNAPAAQSDGKVAFQGFDIDQHKPARTRDLSNAHKCELYKYACDYARAFLTQSASYQSLKRRTRLPDKAFDWCSSPRSGMVVAEGYVSFLYPTGLKTM